MKTVITFTKIITQVKLTNTGQWSRAVKRDLINKTPVKMVKMAKPVQKLTLESGI